MINLLPDAYKKTLDREHWLRIIATNCLFFCYVAVISLVLFFPSYILTKVRVDEAHMKNDTLQAQQGSVHDVTKTIQDLAAAAQKAREISPRLTTTSLHDLLGVLVDKPTGIRITEISYTNRTDTNQMVFVGKARTRESLTAFNKFLSARPEFSHVDIPISNFAKDSNFEFSATVTIKPPQ